MKEKIFPGVIAETDPEDTTVVQVDLDDLCVTGALPLKRAEGVDHDLEGKLGAYGFAEVEYFSDFPLPPTSRIRLIRRK